MDTDKTKVFPSACFASALLWAVILIGTVSCNKETQFTGDGERALDTEVSFMVAEAVDDQVHTRADVVPTEEATQTFMGMEVTTSVTDETVARTRATVYNTVNLNGRRVSAYVFDPSTNKTVAGVQTLYIRDNKLTVKGCRGCRILFYIGTSVAPAIGTDITTITVNESRSNDAMQCISDVITENGSDLGTLSFKHVFTKIRVTMKTSDGTLVNAFSLSTVLGYYRAMVNIASREYVIPSPPSPSTSSSPADTLTTHTFSVSNNTSPVAEAAWVDLIAPATPRALRLAFGTAGNGVTIGGARNYLTTNVNDILTLQSHTFLPGHRYSIDITVSPTSIEPYMNAGFKADMAWYQWDAYEPLDTGDSLTWSPGNSGVHPLSGSESSGQDIAVQSCKDCPSLKEARMYIGAGVLADNGHTGPYQPSYTVTHPATGVKTTYHSGMWLKKKQYIPGFAEGTAPQVTSVAASLGRPTAETIDQYFFLPLFGFRDMTNGNSLLSAGEYGYYHLRTANSNARPYLLKLTTTGASVGTSLNWTTRNVCSNNIWSAD